MSKQYYDVVRYSGYFKVSNIDDTFHALVTTNVSWNKASSVFANGLKSERFIFPVLHMLLTNIYLRARNFREVIRASSSRIFLAKNQLLLYGCYMYNNGFLIRLGSEH